MSDKIIGKISITPKGQYVYGQYSKLDLVTNDGSSYLSIKDDNISDLTVKSDWMVVAEKGQAFTYDMFTIEQIEELKVVGDSGVYVGETEPTDENIKVWIKPDGEDSLSNLYYAEIITSPIVGILTLKNATETVLSSLLTSSNVFTIALPTPVIGKVNESVLIFKIGATLPTITQPSGLVWRGKTPTYEINTSWTIVYEQVNTTGTTFETWATALKNS